MPYSDPSGSRNWLSTAQVAQLLAVSPATVKRWAEAGVLEFERTPGGHRRFSAEAVEQLRRATGNGRAGASSADAWLGLLLAPAPDLTTEVALLEARARAGSWTAVADGFGPVLAELGERWTRGQVSVLDEHLAAARLARALAWAAANQPVAPSAPVALLATLEGESHTLGLSLAEICLREAGFSTRWAGAHTPVADLEAVARDGGVDALAISASVCAAPGLLAEAGARLGAAAGAGGVRLVLGGSGAWPEPPPAGVRLRTFAELRIWAGAPGR